MTAMSWLCHDYTCHSMAHNEHRHAVLIHYLEFWLQVVISTWFLELETPGRNDDRLGSSRRSFVHTSCAVVVLEYPDDHAQTLIRSFLTLSLSPGRAGETLDLVTFVTRSYTQLTYFHKFLSLFARAGRENSRSFVLWQEILYTVCASPLNCHICPLRANRTLDPLIIFLRPYVPDIMLPTWIHELQISIKWVCIKHSPSTADFTNAWGPNSKLGYV